MDGEFTCLWHTGVAQLVEHWSPKPGVGRSSRSSRANRKDYEKNSNISSGILQGIGAQSNLAFLEGITGQCNSGHGFIPNNCSGCCAHGSCIQEHNECHL